MTESVDSSTYVSVVVSGVFSAELSVVEESDSSVWVRTGADLEHFLALTASTSNSFSSTLTFIAAEIFESSSLTASGFFFLKRLPSSSSSRASLL